MNLKFIYERTDLNQYGQIDYLVNNFSNFVDDVVDMPIFYRNNMIIVRSNFLLGLLKASSTENSMRIAIYMVFCLMVLHAPVAGKDKTKYQGVERNLLVKKLGFHRNDFSLAMNVLMNKIGIVVQLDDGKYAFSINKCAENTSESALLEMREVFIELSKLTQVFYQSDLLSSIVLDADEDGTEIIEAENEDDMVYLINAILEGCTIPRWVNELLAVTDNGEVNYSSLVLKAAELAADSPLVSSCGEFVLIRQEILEYIILYGHRKPVLDDLDMPQGSQLTKSAIVVLIYLFLTVDEEGYLRKNGDGSGLMQLKDISIGCGLSLSIISKAIGWWKSIGVIEKTKVEGIHGYRFSNKLMISVAGKRENYLNYRKKC